MKWWLIGGVGFLYAVAWLVMESELQRWQWVGVAVVAALFIIGTEVSENE